MGDTTTTQHTDNTTQTQAKPARHIDVSVELVDGHATTTSLAVAERFGKLHKDVLKRIASLECSPEFRERNFAPTFQRVPGPNGATREEPAFRMTRDGFTFLCMGFTGKEAAKFKEAYISAFNQMEAILLQHATALPSADGTRREVAFEGKRIRVWMRDGQPWFSAANVASALRLRCSNRITRSAAAGEVCNTHRGRQAINYLSAAVTLRAGDYAERQLGDRWRIWAERTLAELCGKQAGDSPLSERDLACLYAMCEAGERLVRAHHELAPVHKAMRSNALFGVPAALETFIVGGRHLRNRFGDGMKSAAQHSGLADSPSCELLGVQLSNALGEPPLRADQHPMTADQPLQGELDVARNGQPAMLGVDLGNLSSVEQYAVQQLLGVRLMLSLDECGAASVKSVPHEAAVVTPDRLAGLVSDSIAVPAQYLSGIINAAVARLAQGANLIGKH